MIPYEIGEINEFNCKICSSGAYLSIGEFGCHGSIERAQGFKCSSVQLGLLKSNFDNQPALSGQSTGMSTWSTLGSVRFDHMQALDDTWLLGVVAGFNLSDSKSLRGGSGGQTYEIGGETPAIATPDSNYTYTTGGGTLTRLSKQVSLQLQLGYALSKKQLLLGKVGFHRSQIDVNNIGGAGSYSMDCQAINPACEDYVAQHGLANGGASNIGKSHLTGYSLGVGYRHQIENHWFIQFDAQKIFYRQNVMLNIKPSVTEFGLNLGYRF